MPSSSFAAEHVVSHIRTFGLDTARALYQDIPYSPDTAELPPNTALVDRWCGRGSDVLFVQPLGPWITAIIADNADSEFSVPVSDRVRMYYPRDSSHLLRYKPIVLDDDHDSDTHSTTSSVPSLESLE